MESPISICWFRRDLRLNDNAAFYYALKSGRPVLPLFIFDRHILDDLEKTDRRVAFIHAALEDMQAQLRAIGSALEVHYGYPLDIFHLLAGKYNIGAVYANQDYEPYATQRDTAVAQLMKEQGAGFYGYKDQVVLDNSEVLKDDGKPYTVFTPYARRWRSILNDFYLKSYPTQNYFEQLFRAGAGDIPSLASMGFTATGMPFPSKKIKKELIHQYHRQRDYPGIDGTSRLGPHLRFGTISIRDLARQAKALNDTYLNELVWREFYQMICWHFPRVGEGKSFRPEYDFIQWRNNEAEFHRWCSGTTGYPLVDAGMRELNETGYMHNRVRMVTASFLAKHLLVDWRWGEAYFAQQLLDYDFASNNGGWQWAAGSGCDAAPYFRIFNPALQTKRFDKDLVYIRKWVPELDELSYPAPMVEHAMARKRCLEVYGRALKK